MQVVDLQNIEHLTVADRDYLSNVFETFLEVCYCYGLNKGPYISKLKSKFIRYWGDLVSLDPLWNHVEKDVNGKTIVGSYNVKCLMTLTKYKMCAFFSYMTHTELPKCPPYWERDDPSVLIGGVINRWIRHFSKMAWGTHGNEASDFIALTHKQFLFSFCQAIKMSKRQMPRADIPMVWRSMVGTYQKLTTAPVVPAFPDPFLLPTELFLESRVCESGSEDTYVELLKFYTRKMMSGLDMSKLHSLKMHPFAPSRSATFIHSRSEFGQAGEIALFGGTGNVAEIFGKIDVTCNWSADFLSATMVCEVNLAKARAAYNYSMSHCFDGYRAQCREYMSDDGNGEEICYRPVSILAPIPEPLKVRNVSKGPGEVPEFLKPDQDAMIGHIGHYNCCCVGRKESPEEMRRALGGILLPDEYYLSVDYEDSTNNLRREFSKIISEEIFSCCNVDPIARVVWSETLYGGSVTLPSVPKSDLRDCSFPNELMEQINQCEPARMKRGQLMGNIVSFPVLCLANGFCLWLSRMVSTGAYCDPRYEKYVVNGDDGVVRVNQNGYGFWKLLSSWMGFPPSIGKVYLSRDFFDFNSKFFSVVENPCSLRGFEFLGCPEGVVRWFDEPDELLIQQIPFCYVSLCHGKSRTGTNRDITELMGLDRGLSIGALQENFLSQAPKETHARMMSLFYTHLLYRSDIYAKIKGLAWYLPVCVGGLGLKPLLQEEYNKISVGGGRAIWAAQPRKCDFSLGSPPEYLKCTRRSSEGVEKTMACGPSKLDLQLAYYIGKRLTYHENDLVKQDEIVLPVKPKLQPNFNLAPPCPLLNFTFDTPQDYDSSAESVWSFWGNIDRFRKELLRKKGFVKSQEYEARIVSQWMSQWRKFWRQVKAQNDCTEGFVNIYGLRSESPIVIRDTCTDDEVQSLVLHCKSPVEYGRETPFIVDWWIRSNVLSIKRMPVFWPLLTLLI